MPASKSQNLLHSYSLYSMHRRVIINCIDHVYVTKYHLFAVFLINKSPEKCSRLFSFTLRHHMNVTVDEPVYSRQSATPVSLLMLPIGLWGSGGPAKCGYLHMLCLINMHNIHKQLYETYTWLDSMCSAERQQLQLCNIATHSYVQFTESACSCMQCAHRVCLL